MFKNLINEIKEIVHRAENRLVGQAEDHNAAMRRCMQEVVKTGDSIYSETKSISKTVGDIVEAQQRTIEVLTKALMDKYEKGLFIYSEDGKIPMVIRNGKQLTDDLTNDFSIAWTHGDFPNIEINQVAGTHHDWDR